MSTKNEFLSSGGFFASSITLVTLLITCVTGPAAVSQQPPEERPLVGGFKIDFGDSVDGVSAGVPAGLSVDSAAVSATKTAAAPPAERPAEPPANPYSVEPAQAPGATPQNSVTGLPQTALPMAFPAAAPQSGTAKGPATLIHAGDMIGFSRELGDGVQAITIINASRRWMAVYHIDTSGKIRLTSSRPLDADFTIQFNAAAPMPEDIRRLQGK